MPRDWLWRSALVAALTLLAPQWAVAQSKPEFIAFPGTSKAALYRPDAGPAPHVGILVMHRTANFLAHRACTELSRRGFMMLCMNTRFENNEFREAAARREGRGQFSARPARHQQGRLVCA
jgi:hypothetical protein